MANALTASGSVMARYTPAGPASTMSGSRASLPIPATALRASAIPPRRRAASALSTSSPAAVPAPASANSATSAAESSSPDSFGAHHPAPAAYTSAASTEVSTEAQTAVFRTRPSCVVTLAKRRIP